MRAATTRPFASSAPRWTIPPGPSRSVTASPPSQDRSGRFRAATSRDLRRVWGRKAEADGGPWEAHRPPGTCDAGGRFRTRFSANSATGSRKSDPPPSVFSPPKGAPATDGSSRGPLEGGAPPFSRVACRVRARSAPSAPRRRSAPDSSDVPVRRALRTPFPMVQSGYAPSNSPSYPPRILSPPEDRIGVDNRTVRALRRGRSPGDRSRFDRSVPPIPYDPQSCANSRSRAKEPVNEASEVRGARGTMARGIRGRPIVPEERSVVRPRNLAAPGNDLTGYATESPLAAGSPSGPSRSGKPVARRPVGFRSRTVARDRIPLAPGAGRNRRNRRGSPRGAAPAFPFRRTRRAGARALSVRMRLPAGPSFDTVGSQP